MTQFYSRNDVKYNGDVYSIPFDYIKEQEIQVYLDDVLFTDWSFLQKSQIKLNKIPSGITNKTIVSVRRVTDISKKEVDYSNNTLLDKASLNTSQDQLLHAVQEIYDNNIEFKDETTAQVASFEARVEEVEATTAESANIVAENAVLSASAFTNSEQAVATANSAYDTATEALLTSEQANSFATEARDSATIALDIAVTSGNKVDVFEESIDTVLEAADKITVLEGAVGEATEAAQAAQEAVQAVGEMIDAIDGKANVDLDNLSEAGQAKLDEKANINLSNLTPEAQAKFDVKANAVDVLDKSQITNCITEVPQRIKYTLENGTFTLLAGSVMIFPHGTTDLSSSYPVGSDYYNSNFKVVDRQYANGLFFIWAEIQTDKTISQVGTVTSNNNILYVNAKNNNFGYNGANLVSSGDTKPTVGQIWYDTTNNILYSSSDGFNTYTQREISFPICNFTREEGVITNINQVFNGMGYIGSSQWYDKDIVGLSPNGLNSDGTYNNAEIRRTSLTVRTFGTDSNSYNWQLSSSAHRDYKDYYVQDTQPALSGNWLWHDTLNNKLYGYTDSTGLRDMSGTFFIGGFGTRTKGVVTSFNPKQTFRAVDYNEYRTEIDSKVSKSGDTMTGNLIISRDTASIIECQNVNMDYTSTEASSSNTYCGGMNFYDKNYKSLGTVRNRINTSGIVQTQMVANRNVNGTDYSASVVVGVDTSGNALFTFPMCTTKATTTSSASTAKVAVVTQNYVNGSSWYRVWSDGWKEQGGRGAHNTTVTLLKAFSNTNYCITGTAYGVHYNQTYEHEMIKDITTKGFTILAADGATVIWYACGY